jgi:hypothetical protein
MNPSISITDRNDKFDRPQSSNHPNCLDPLLEWSGDIDKKWLQEIPDDVTLHFDIQPATNLVQAYLLYIS